MRYSWCMVASAVPPFRETPEERAEFDRLVREARAALDGASIDHEQAVQLRGLVDSLAALRPVLRSEPIARPVIALIEALMGRIQTARAPRPTVAESIEQRFARMQTPEARARMQAAFEATPEELGAAAVAAAKRRD